MISAFVVLIACENQQKEKFPSEKENILKISHPKNKQIRTTPTAPGDTIPVDSLQNKMSIPEDTVKPVPLMNYRYFKKTFSLHKRGYIS